MVLVFLLALILSFVVHFDLPQLPNSTALKLMHLCSCHYCFGPGHCPLTDPSPLLKVICILKIGHHCWTPLLFKLIIRKIHGNLKFIWHNYHNYSVSFLCHITSCHALPAICRSRTEFETAEPNLRWQNRI